MPDIPIISGALDWLARAAHAVGQALPVASDVVSVVVPLGVLLLWALGRNPLVRSALKRDRRRTVGRSINGSTGERLVPWSPAWKTCRVRVSTVLSDTASLTPAAELHWLDAQGTDPDRPLSAFGAGTDPAGHVQGLADAFRALAARQRARGLFGGGSAPVIGLQADVADRVAAHLGTSAAFLHGKAPTLGQLRLDLVSGATSLHLSHLAPDTGPDSLINTMGVTHIPDRVVIPGGLSEQLAKRDGVHARIVLLTPEQGEALESSMVGKFFDGVLPSLRRAEVQRDGTSGWLRLHLTLAETSYSAVRATQYVGQRGLGSTREELQAQAKVLTLSCLPLTSDGFLVITRRSEHVPFAGRLNPGVNGNLEMRTRYGVGHDNDGMGLPDPLRALAREGREELALDIHHHDIQILGTCLFSNDQEVGTTVLLTHHRTDLTATELAVRAGRADPAEGLWELDDQITFLPMPGAVIKEGKIPDLVEQTLRWTLNATDHQPHLTSCLIAHYSGLLHHHFRRPPAPGAARPSLEEARASVETYLGSLVEMDPDALPVPPPPGTRHLTRGIGEAVEVPTQP